MQWPLAASPGPLGAPCPAAQHNDFVEFPFFSIFVTEDVNELVFFPTMEQNLADPSGKHKKAMTGEGGVGLRPG